MKAQHCKLFGKDTQAPTFGSRKTSSVDPLQKSIEEMTKKPIQGFPKDKKDVEIEELIEDITAS